MPIRSAHAGDAGRLSDLAFRSKAYWGYADDFMAQCRDELTYTPEQAAGGGFWVLEDDGEVRGFCGLTRVSPNTMELEALFIEPGHIGHGCGRELMRHAVARAAGTEHIQRLIIQADPNAAEFYEAAGAVRIGERASDSVAGRALPLYEIRFDKED